MRNKLRTLVLLNLLLSFVLLVPPNASAQTPNLLGATVTGTVYFVGGFRASRSRPFTLKIDRFTSAEEVRRLEDALRSGGQDALLREMSGMTAGRIQLGTGVGLPANVILATPSDGRTKVTVLYQRDVRFGELRYGTRSSTYRVGYAEMYLGGGANEGMLIPAAYVRIRDGNTWEVEDFGTFPGRLMGLRVRGGRTPR